MDQPETNLELPADGDYLRAKRDLLREGVQRGELSISDIRIALPPPHVGPSELEVFLFALDALGVRVVDENGEEIESEV
ncbi:MAG: RNA polymerase sigma factor region1.1 domain-containing protein [Myxococcales bacterium]|nr:RNA polymerase sigma factor region1.1 domain-containing protein [Myxococcales bacterium]